MVKRDLHIRCAPMKSRGEERSSIIMVHLLPTLVMERMMQWGVPYAKPCLTTASEPPFVLLPSFTSLA